MANAVLNRIPSGSRTFRSEVSALWSSPTLTLDFTADVEKILGLGSIKTTLITSGSSSSGTIDFNNLGTSDTCVTTTNDVGHPIEFWCWFKTESFSVVDITLKLYDSAGNVYTSISNTENISTSEWVLLRSSKLIVDDDTFNYSIGASIDVSSSTPPPAVYVTSPAIVGILDFVRNDFATDIWLTYIPEFLRDEDRTSSQQYALGKFLDTLTTVAGQVKDFVFDSAFVDESDGYADDDDTSKSIFVDPDVADRVFLNYLSQFTGTKLINPRTGSTPWVNLPTTWVGIDNIDSVIDNQVPWGVMELFDPEPAQLIEFLRWQTKFGYYGINAGSKTAVVESVKRALTGTQNITYSIPSPFNVTITTLISETPNTVGLVAGDEVPEIVALIEPARPLGVVVTHVLA